MDDHKKELQYQRLYVSLQDFGVAKFCLNYLLKRGLHHAPFERRGTVYLQQVAYTSAFIVAYGRPFTKSKGWPAFPEKLILFDQDEAELHKNLMDLRHQVYAHSDSNRYYVKPLLINGYPSAILGAPEMRLTKQEASLALVMLEKLISSVTNRLPDLV